MLGAHLAAHGTETRIRILLDDLLGSAHTAKQKHSKILVSRAVCTCAQWLLDMFSSHRAKKVHKIDLAKLILYFVPIQNIDKHTLMDKVLFNLKQEPKWQRIYMEYSEQLNEIKSILTVVNGIDIEMT